MSLTRTGWPRPVVGGLPIPWVSPSDDLSTMNQARAAACASGAVCAVCGESYSEGEEAFSLIRAEALPADLSTGSIHAMDNAVMHRRCVRLALAVCPKLKELANEGVLTIIETTGNNAVPAVFNDKLTAVIDGEHCKVVDNVSPPK